MPTLYGSLEKITYCNEENGFMVARIREKGQKGLTTIVGNLSGVQPGESLKLTGNWVQNKKYGEQFQVDSYEGIVPATLVGIKKYLGSGFIKGIGPVMAERIVDQFGIQSLDIIEKSPKRLAEVDGIGSKRIEMISAAWKDQKEIKEIMIFLQGHGVSPTYSLKIYKQYSQRSIGVVRENPYCLARDIHGIGFLTADKIAKSLGIAPHDPLRVKAGILYTLTELTGDGHVYYPEDELISRAGEILKVEADRIISALTVLSREKEIFIETIGESPRMVYLASFYKAETGVARMLKTLRDAPSNIRAIRPEKAIEWVQEKLGIELAEHQKEAVALAACTKVLTITGGPGTGKTTIITAIIKILHQMNLKVLLAAPTGRAAKRMSEATNHEAKTIHRLLEFSPKKGGFKKDRDDPLKADAVIIDESSMMDLLLIHDLLLALPSHAHLILVGDIDQLPSVGPGSVLKDIIHSGAFKVIRLTEIFRQAQESMIVMNAHKINQGDFPALPAWNRKEGKDFFFIQEENPEMILEKVLELCAEEIPRHFGFHPIKDIQVLTPMHKGVIGSVNLNAALQARLNPATQCITYGIRTFKLGDKVMQTENNYDKEVFNGDIGWISKIDQEEKEVTVDFEGKSVLYEFSDLDELVIAYAISVHKSQGSEYPAAVFLVSTQHYILLQRNLLYTGLTRAKKLVVVIGTQKALAIAIKNNKPRLRYTYLSERLKG